MLDLGTARRTARTEWGRFAELADELTDADLDRPTRLAGWQVRDLVGHVAWGMGMEADALRQMAAGDPTVARGPAVDTGADAATLAGVVRESRQAFESALEQLTGADLERPVVLPTSTVPAAFAATVFAFEASLHTADLADALGRPSDLGQDGLAACASFAGPFLQFAGDLGEPAADGTSYALVGEDFRAGVLRAEGRWVPRETTNAPATATLAGPDEALLLFALGRLPLAVAPLDVSGDGQLAARFKVHFPGP